jgi:hypothetical protein
MTTLGCSMLNARCWISRAHRIEYPASSIEHLIHVHRTSETDAPATGGGS